MYIDKFTYEDKVNAFGNPKTTLSARFTPPLYNYLITSKLKTNTYISVTTWHIQLPRV